MATKTAEKKEHAANVRAHRADPEHTRDPEKVRAERHGEGIAAPPDLAEPRNLHPHDGIVADQVRPTQTAQEEYSGLSAQLDHLANSMVMAARRHQPGAAIKIGQDFERIAKRMGEIDEDIRSGRAAEREWTGRPQPHG